VSEDSVAVAEAITGRMRELKLSQRDLAVQSNVSVATIREIQRHRISRRRNPRTLESLSETLGWPRQHLDAVLNGRLPQDPAETGGDDDLRSRLDELEHRLAMIADVVHRIDAKIDIIIDLRHGRDAAVARAGIPAARSGLAGREAEPVQARTADYRPLLIPARTTRACSRMVSVPSAPG
jgi:transcriptional regulator with XRE-family HTH domain